MYTGKDNAKESNTTEIVDKLIQLSGLALEADKDSAIYGTSVKTNRWYMRIFFWILDRVIFLMYIIVVQLTKQGGDHKGWEHYADHRNGQSDFEIDLGLALIEKGICMEDKRQASLDVTNRSNMFHVIAKGAFFVKRERLLVLLTKPVAIKIIPPPRKADVAASGRIMLTWPGHVSYAGIIKQEWVV